MISTPHILMSDMKTNINQFYFPLGVKYDRHFLTVFVKTIIYQQIGLFLSFILDSIGSVKYCEPDSPQAPPLATPPLAQRRMLMISCRRLFSTKWTREILWTDNTRKTQCWVNRTGQAFFPFNLWLNLDVTSRATVNKIKNNFLK